MYLGGIDKVHRLDDLMRAIHSLGELQNRVVVELVGSGKEVQNLKNLANQYNLENITWSKAIPKSKVAEKLMEADVLFLSTGEVFYGSENKLAEYLNAAKPILTYTPATHNDPVEKTGCGLSAAFGDVDDLALKIKMFSETDAETRLQMGRKGHRYAAENLSWHKLAGELEIFLEKLLYDS